MSDDDDTTTSGGAGHYYYSGGGGGATNAFRQHLAKQLGGGDGEDAPLTRLQQVQPTTGAGGNKPSPLSPSRNNYNYGGGNNNQRDVGYSGGGDGGDGASSSSPSAHIKISALKEQVSRLEEALSNSGGGMGGGSGGGGSASEVLEGKYMEVVKKNRDITVRYESERSKVTKLMRQIVALEEKNMVLQQERNVTLPSQQPQSARGGNGGYGVQNNGGEAPPTDDAESIAKQLKKDLDISTKSLVLFRKQCDEQKREIVRMRKILLKELGDEATLGRAQAAIGGEDDMLDDNVSLAGSVAASTVTTRTDGRGGGGQPTWKGRAEQIQLLNMKVKTLQRKLERGVVPLSEDASAMDDGMSMVSGTTARRGAPSVATRDYDDVHTVMLENKASQKRQELDDAKQTIKKLEEALGKERTKAEGLSSRMRIVEKDSQSLKGNLQTLIGKACNDDALIASYKERLEGLREENKVLVEKIKDEARKQRERGEEGVSVGKGGGGAASTFSQSQQGQVDSAMLQGLRRQVSKLEQQNSTLLAEVDELKHDLLRAQAAASARPPSGNGAMAAKSRRRRGSGTTTGDDDSSDEEVGRNKKPTNKKTGSSATSSRFSWLVDPATGELTKLTAAASSSSSVGGNASLSGSTHAAVVEAIARAADVILSQRAAIQFYEKRAQQQQQRAAEKSGDRLITEENQYLRERIKMLTDQNTREATVLQGNFTQLLEGVLQSISNNNNLEAATRGSPSATTTTTSRQAWPSQQNSTPREQPPPTQSNSSSSVGGFLPSIVPTKASTPILTSSKGAIRADTEPPTLGRANTADVALSGSRPGKSGGAVSVSAVASGSGGPRKGTAEASVGRTVNRAGGELPVRRRDNAAVDEQDGMEPMSYAEAQRLAIEARERKEALLSQKRKEAKGGGRSITTSNNEDFNQQTPSRRRFDDGVDKDGPVIDSDGEEESAHTALVSRKHAPPQPVPTQKTKAPTASRSQQQPSGAKPVVARDANNRKPQPSPPPPPFSSQQSSPPPPHQQQQYSIVDPLEAQAKLAGGRGDGRGGGGGFVASIGVKISDPVPKKKQQPAYLDSDDDDDDGSGSGRGGGGMPTYGDETPGEGYSITPRSDYGGDDDPSFWVGEENTKTNGARGTGGGIKSNTTTVTRPPPKQQRKPTTTATHQQQSPSSFAPGVLPTYRPGGGGGVDSPTTPDSHTGYANQFASRGRNLGGAMPGATRARF